MPPRALSGITVALMARAPEPGAVKTRLTGDGGYRPEAAAGLAEAMLRCVAARLVDAAGRIVLAVTPDGRAAGLARQLGLPGLEPRDQGPGDLGERLGRVWRAAGGGPVAFFGGDSPDVPGEALEAIPAALGRADVAVGPTRDGGYWTLAARSYRPELLAGIDWGGASVYRQTLRRAAEAGLLVAELPVWDDVDRPADVRTLRLRLDETGAGASGPLRDLAASIDRLSGGCP